MVIKEVQVKEKRYKRERYYDIDIVPYFMDEREEVRKRIRKYAEILAQATLAVFEKCLDEVKPFMDNTLMAKHGITLEKDEVKHFTWTILYNLVYEIGFREKKLYRPPLETIKNTFSI